MVQEVLQGLTGAAFENTEGAGVAVQKSGLADGADLAVAEKSAERDIAQLVLEHIRVVVGFAVKILHAPQAGKKNRVSSIDVMLPL